MISRVVVIIGILGSCASIAGFLGIGPVEPDSIVIVVPVITAALISVVVCVHSICRLLFSVQSDFLVTPPEKSRLKWAAAVLIGCGLLSVVLCVLLYYKTTCPR